MILNTVLSTFSAFVTLSIGAQSALPNIGDRYELKDKSTLLLVSPGQVYPAEEATFEGSVFKIAVNPKNEVAYIATSNSTFKTQEGISAESTLADVLRVGGSSPVHERGWAYRCDLPSGWSVAFHSIDFGSTPPRELSEPIVTTRVAWIFKRRRS